MLTGQHAGARKAVQIAAALGQQVLGLEWEAACRHAGVKLAAALIEALMRARLIEPTEGGYRFAHVMIQECLEGEARREGHWAELNRACALALGIHTDPGRRGRLLYESGDLEGACNALLAGARRHLDAFAFREALPLTRLLDDHVLAGTVIAAADRRRGEANLIRVRTLIGMGQLQDADRAAMRAAESARTQRWPDIRARALRYRGMALEKIGDLPLAEAVFTQAEVLAEVAGDEENLAACLEHRGTLLRHQGDLSGSSRLLEDALVITRRLGESRLIADCLKELGGTLVNRGLFSDAEPLLREALALYTTLGSVTGRAACLNNIGELERMAGDFVAAEATYQAAFDVLFAAGHHASVIPLLNIGQIRISLQDYASATTILERGVALAGTLNRRAMALHGHARLLVCRAASGDWIAFDRDLDSATALTAETGLVDAEIAASCRLAAELAERAGEGGRAQAARTLSSAHHAGTT